MVYKFLSSLIIMIVSLSVTACSSAKEESSASDKVQVSVFAQKHSGVKSQYMPKAVIYKTNGDYSKNIFINLNDARTQVMNYPAPSDVSYSSAPVALGDGWLLDRRGGISRNSAFLTYTYDEYSHLSSVPSPSELMQKIIPGAYVEDIVLTPVLVSDAIANPELVKKFIPEATGKQL